MAGSILKHLEAILDTGSVVAASRKLYVSQPSLSQYVKRLEADYDIVIFDRSSTPWTLTEDGRTLLDAQRRIADIERQCRQVFADKKQLRTGSLIIGSTQYRTGTLLNPVLSVFKAAHPGVDIQILEGTTQEAADLAEAGRTDCSFVISSMVPPSLERVAVFHETVLVALPACHPYAAAHPTRPDAMPVIDFRQLEGTPFIVMKRGQVFHEYFADLCQRYGTGMPIALQTQSILTVPPLVESGIAGALVPSTIAQDCLRRGIALYRLEPGVLPVNEVSLAWRRGYYLSHAARAFIDTAVKVLARVQEGVPL